MANSLDLALGRRGRNKIINPDGAYDQRNNGAKVIAAVGGTNYYGPDRRTILGSQANKLSIQQWGVVLGAKQPTNYSTKLTVEASAVPAAGDYFISVLQAFEGLRMRDLLWGSSFARPVAYTIVAQVPVAGPYSFAIRSGNFGRSYVTTIPFSQANVLETHTVIVPGDTQGAYATDNSLHSSLSLSLGSGVNVTTSNLNQWQAGNFVHAAGAISLMGTAGNAVYVAFDQYERDFPTDFQLDDPEEIILDCLRYFERRSYPAGNMIFPLQAQSATAGFGVLNFSRKRAAPTSIPISGSIIALNSTGGSAGGTFAYSASTLDSVRLDLSGASGLVAGNATAAFSNGGTVTIDIPTELI